MNISVRNRLCLQWWVEALACGLIKQTQLQYVDTLGVTWRDGSGTGAGGTFNLASPHLISDVITLNIW